MKQKVLLLMMLCVLFASRTFANDCVKNLQQWSDCRRSQPEYGQSCCRPKESERGDDHSHQQWRRSQDQEWQGHSSRPGWNYVFGPEIRSNPRDMFLVSSTGQLRKLTVLNDEVANPVAVA